MGILVALVVIAAVAFLVSRLKPGAPDDEGYAEETPVPELGVGSVPDGWVEVRSSLLPGEGAVLQSVLDANGVRSALGSMDPMGRNVMNYPAPDRWLRLCVAPEDADTARELLA